jgi:hypothetical protein
MLKIASLARSLMGLVPPPGGAWILLPRAVPAMTRIGASYRRSMPMPDLEIVCVDCGGSCFPLGWRPEHGEVDDGTIVPYRCRDCLDRWDIVIGEPYD